MRKNDALQQYDTGAVLKVSALTNGDVLADGKQVELPQLDVLLADLAQRKGVVWYYREAGREEPPPHAMQVLQLVVKHRRPISLSSKADFSDTIDQHGKSVPRVK